MNDVELKSQHFEFFSRNDSGCAFAAYASRNADRLEWAVAIMRNSELPGLDSLIEGFVADPSVSTLSIILPDVVTDSDLDALIPMLNGKELSLYEEFDSATNRCYRFRARVLEEFSFVSGFGPFSYFPVTRQTPSTALVMRVSARPLFTWDLKEPTPGIVHVADMDMKGLADRQLKRMWGNSFLRTAGLLGHKPNEESAAKTTFVVPLERARKISL